VSSRTSSLGPSPSKQKVLAPGYGLANRPKQVRHRLRQYHNFDHAVELLKKASKIVVLSGAGISTSLGIPDFRSDSGLFTQLSKHGYSDPEDLFHIGSFRVDPDTFFEVVADIIPPAPDGTTSRFSPTHAFIKLLEDKDKLLTNYTQNIDDLEAAAKVSKEKVIQCHGSFATATCCSCGRTVKAEVYLPKVRKRLSPKCPRCLKRPNGSERCGSKSKTGKKRKRQEWEDDESDIASTSDATRGIFKPDIVFYGEKVSQKFWPRFDQDKEKVDLVLILGTSLQVEPVKNILSMIPADVPQIYISKTACTGGWPDIELLGQCDVVVAELAQRAGWQLDHEMNVVGKDGHSVKVENALLGFQHQHFVRLTMSREEACARSTK
jgi:NAD-dependent histone deacetylase SIR2